MDAQTPNYDEDRARHAWFNLTDEASAEDFLRSDFDADDLDLADRFAARHNLPEFDDLRDIERAQRLWIKHTADVTGCDT